MDHGPPDNMACGKAVLIRLAPCAIVQIMSNNFVRTPEKVEEVLQGAVTTSRYHATRAGVP